MSLTSLCPAVYISGQALLETFLNVPSVAVVVNGKRVIKPAAEQGWRIATKFKSVSFSTMSRGPMIILAIY